MVRYVHLTIAILAEVAATMPLPTTTGVARIIPWFGVLAGYGAAFYFLSLALRTMPIAIAYALWSGIGTSFVAVLSSLIWRQPIELPQIAGSALLHLGPHAVHLPECD